MRGGRGERGREGEKRVRGREKGREDRIFSQGN